MAEVPLTAAPRSATGSRAAKRFRREGLVPGVVYGRGSSARPVIVQRRDLRAALTTEAGFNALLDLQVDGERLLAIVRETQRDPVRNEVTHVDFILVSRDVAVTVEVPLVLEGEAEEVHREGGTVDQQLHTLTVSAKPGDIPASIPVDISGLTIGGAVRVGDLTLPAGSSTEVDPEEAVVVAQVSQAALEAEALDIAAAEALEVEAAEAAEGEAAPAGEAEAAEGDAGAGSSEESEDS